MANTIVFQGVEIFIPAEVAFVHRDGCLEIDISTGISGKLVLKRGEGRLNWDLYFVSVATLQSRHIFRQHSSSLVHDTLDAQINGPQKRF